MSHGPVIQKSISEIANISDSRDSLLVNKLSLTSITRRCSKVFLRFISSLYRYWSRY